LRGASNRYYIGTTDDSERRVAEHGRSSNHTTRRFAGKIELIASKKFPSMKDARRFEQHLKRKKNPRLALFALQSRG